MAARLNALAMEAGSFAAMTADLQTCLSIASIAAEKRALGDASGAATAAALLEPSFSPDSLGLLTAALRSELRAARTAAEADEQALAALAAEVAAQARAIGAAKQRAAIAEEDAADASKELAAATSRLRSAKESAETEAPGARRGVWAKHRAAEEARARAASAGEDADARRGEPQWHSQGYVAGYKLLVQDLPESWERHEIVNWMAGFQIKPDEINWLPRPPSRRQQLLLTFRDRDSARLAKRTLHGRQLEARKHPSQTRWLRAPSSNLAHARRET